MRSYRTSKPTGATDRRLWSALAVYPLDHRDRFTAPTTAFWCLRSGAFLASVQRIDSAESKRNGGIWSFRPAGRGLFP